MDKDPIVISGCVAKYDTKFMDGRTIKKGAFDQQDATEVPVTLLIGPCFVGDKDNRVIGHAVLKSKEDGMYATAYIYNTEENQRFLRQQFDMNDDTGCMLGIFANQLKESPSRSVEQGTIRSMAVVGKCDNGASIDDIQNFEGTVDLKNSKKEKKKVARPPKDDLSKKSENYRIRLTPVEHAWLSVMAKETGGTMRDVLWGSFQEKVRAMNSDNIGELAVKVVQEMETKKHIKKVAKEITDEMFEGIDI